MSNLLPWQKYSPKKNIQQTNTKKQTNKRKENKLLHASWFHGKYYRAKHFSDDIAPDRKVLWTILSSNVWPFLLDKLVQYKTLWFGKNIYFSRFIDNIKQEVFDLGIAWLGIALGMTLTWAIATILSLAQ